MRLGQEEYWFIEPSDAGGPWGPGEWGSNPDKPAGCSRHVPLSAFWLYCRRKVVDALLLHVEAMTTSSPLVLLHLPKRNTCPPPAVVSMHLREGLAPASSPARTVAREAETRGKTAPFGDHKAGVGGPKAAASKRRKQEGGIPIQDASFSVDPAACGGGTPGRGPSSPRCRRLGVQVVSCCPWAPQVTPFTLHFPEPVCVRNSAPPWR